MKRTLRSKDRQEHSDKGEAINCTVQDCEDVKSELSCNAIAVRFGGGSLSVYVPGFAVFQ